MGEQRAVGWAALDAAVLQWFAGGGSPELGCAAPPATMREATIELSRRVERGREAGPPAAQTGPEVIAVHAASYGTGGKCLRCGQFATPGTECAPDLQAKPKMIPSHTVPGLRRPCPADVAARHQATIDKAFAQQDTVARERYGDDAIDKLNRLQAEGMAAIEPVDVKRGGPSPADPWPAVCDRIRRVSIAWSELVHELDLLRRARP